MGDNHGTNNNDDNDDDDQDELPKTVSKSEVMDLILQKMQALEKSELEGRSELCNTRICYLIDRIHYLLFDSLNGMGGLSICISHLLWV